MNSRAQLAALQVAVLVGGGLLAPVVHLAGHRADHTHGAGGRTMAFDAASTRGEPAGSLHGEHPGREIPRPVEATGHEHVAEPGGHEHADSDVHPHEHRHTAGGPAHPAPTIDPTGSAPTDGGSPARPDGKAQPLEPAHGHGSLAHFELALLSAAPSLALPAPELTGVLPPAPHPRATVLFQPSFPLPRPPPAARPA